MSLASDLAEREERLRVLAETSDRVYPCGWGGDPACSTTLPYRGLCDVHKAELRAASDRARMGRKKKPKTAEQKHASQEASNVVRAQRDAQNLEDRATERKAKATGRTRAQYTADRSAASDMLLSDRATAVVNYVQAQGGRRVSRIEVSAALGLDLRSVTKASQVASTDGRLSVIFAGRHSGYELPGDAA